MAHMLAESPPNSGEVDPDLLTGRAEADRRRAQGAANGTHEGTVSKARRDPTHPVHTDPRSVAYQVGKRTYRLAHPEAVDAWWADHPPKPEGPPRTRARLPGGLTRPQWEALQAARRGEKGRTAPRNRLIAKGLITAQGEPTDAGRALLDQRATNRADATENR